MEHLAPYKPLPLQFNSLFGKRYVSTHLIKSFLLTLFESFGLLNEAEISMPE